MADASHKGRSVPVGTFEVVNDDGKKLIADNASFKALQKKGYYRADNNGEKMSSKSSPPEEQDEVDLSTMDQEQLTAFIEENELDVDLDDYENIDQMKEAVFEAYSEAE